VRFEQIFVIPKSQDWDVTNPRIRNWRKWPGSLGVTPGKQTGRLVLALHTQDGQWTI